MHRLPSRLTRLGLGMVAAGLLFTGAGPSPEEPSGVVSGTVVDPGGRGIPDVSVYLETDPCCFTEELTVRTDSTGAFEIRGVPSGRVRVHAVHPSFTAGGVSEVDVDPEKGPLPLQIVLERGTRLTGHVYFRDGRPFSAGWVIVTSSHPDADFGFPQPSPLDGDGAFTADSLPPGPGLVYVLALTPHAAPRFAQALPTLSPIHIEPVEIPAGPDALANVTLRDIVVSGRVTREGEPEPGIRVTVSTGPRRSLSLPGLPTPPAGGGPPALEATTGEDGSYELLVFGPGPAHVTLAAVASGQSFPARPVTIPDTDSVALDFELAGATVSGIAVDGDTGAPLPDVSLRLARLDGAAVPGWSDAHGSFTIGAEPGDYVLSAERPGRVRVVRRVRVGPEGLSGVRIEMDRGLAIVGRVVGPAGRPLSGQLVFAVGHDGFERAPVQEDGTFRIEGLGPGPYSLSVGSAAAGFATRRAVTPGPEPVRLTLRPAGRVALRIVSGDGQPVAGAVASIASADGAPVHLRGWAAPPTGEGGTTEISSPPGEIGIAVSAPMGAAFDTVAVRPGETVPLRIVLSPSTKTGDQPE